MVGLSDIWSFFASLWDFLTAVIGGGIEFIAGLFSIIGGILSIVYNMFILIELFVYLIFNPYLLMSFLVGTGLYYAALTAHSRKELVVNLCMFYYSLFAVWIPRWLITMYNLALQMAQILSNVIITLINGILSML